MANLDQYRKDNGFYDEEAIMRDGGMNNRAAAFFSIFGDSSDQKVDELSPEWQALLDEARRLNNETFNAKKQSQEAEAQAIMASPEPWTQQQWQQLVALGYARRAVDEVAEDEFVGSFFLTSEGERLRHGGSYTAIGDYADQADIDG